MNTINVPLNVVILEDSEFSNKVVCDIINSSRHNVLRSYMDGEEFLASFNELQFEVLLLDINLESKKLNGIQVAEIVRLKKPDTYILFLTSSTESAVFQTALQTGPDDYFIKPIDALQLRNKLDLLGYQLLSRNRGIQTFQSRIQQLEISVGQLKKELDFQKINNDELTTTNKHLVSATWREREIKQKLVVALKSLSESKALIDHQNKTINESIDYAKRIQRSINPSAEKLLKTFPECCILYRPKHIVSGDFPWVYEKGEYIYLAAMDCTGHGVPGAMLATIGCLLLNEIASDPEIKSCSDILNELHDKIYALLQQGNENHSNDGMDACLVRLHKTTYDAQFAGSNRPLYYVKEGELHKEKASRIGIGGFRYGNAQIQDVHLKFQQGDTLFLFSDGITDQFGGADDSGITKKFGYNLLKEVMNKAANQPLDHIQQLITHKLSEWQGHEDQTDDMLFMGIKI